MSDFPEELRREIEGAVEPDALIDWDALPGLIAEGAQVAYVQARAEDNAPRVEAIERAVHQPGSTSIRPAEEDRLEVLMGDPPVHVCTIHLSALLRDEPES